MTAPTSKSDHVPLSGPRMPADHGLTSLGLLMQLGGAVFGGFLACSAFILLLTGAPTGALWKPVLVMILSTIRSVYHYRAGRALVHGPPLDSVDGPLSAAERYVKIALVHTGLCALVLYGEVDTQVLALIAVWGGWPLAIYLLLRSPHLRAMSERIPRAEDLALEGASMYMLLFGAIGVMIAGLLTHRMFDAIGFSPSFDILSIYVILGLLLCRSLMHARAGRIGITGDLDSAADHTRRYTRFSAGATVAIVILLFLSMGREAIGLGTIGVLAMIAFLLLCWPRIISRFMDQRLVDTYSKRGQMHERRAPDMGLTALGWLLLALSLNGLATVVPALISGAESARLLGNHAFYAPSLAAVFGRSLWFSVVIHAVQLWAALELIRMLDGYKIPAMLYGLLAPALTLYMIWPFFDDTTLLRYFFDTISLAEGVVVIGQIGVALAVPLTVLVMIHREPPAQARARFRASE